MTMMIFALIRHGSVYLHLIPNPIQFLFLFDTFKPKLRIIIMQMNIYCSNVAAKIMKSEDHNFNWRRQKKIKPQEGLRDFRW